MASPAFVGALVLIGLTCAPVSFGANVEIGSANRARQSSLEASWSAALTVKASPIKRVVLLLQKMTVELDHEAASDGELYDKQVCWCETNEKEKEKAIAEAEATDKDLSADIESRSARFGVLAAEIEQLKKQIAADAASAKEAMAIRENEAGDFRGEEKDLVQAITNLKNAIQVLSRHQSGSFIQLDAAMLTNVRTVLRDVALKHAFLFGDARVGATSKFRAALVAVSTKTQRLSDQASANQDRDLLTALDAHSDGMSEMLPVKMAARALSRAAKPGSNAFLQTHSPYKSYYTQSDTIFGILTQLLEDFEAQLTSSQDSEAGSTESYKKLSAAKASQLDAGKKKLDELETERADNDKKLSDTKEDLETVRKQRSDDVEFLRNLKLTCQDLDKQWAERSKTRSQELTAVAETLKILTGDDNRENLTKAASFFQQSSVAEVKSELKARLTRVSSFLMHAAKAPAFEADDLLADWRSRPNRYTVASEGPRARLSTLAIHAKLDGFEKVKEMMDKMIADLKKQQDEEVTFKARCAKDLDENDKSTYAKEQEKKDLQGKLEELAAAVANLKKEIEEANKQIADTETAIKQASQTRESENTEFQTTVSDQRELQDILKKALTRLEDFYKKNPVLLEQTPPVQFTKYEVNRGASPVMGLIEQIVGDSAKLVAEATEGERSAQADYEAFVLDSNKLKKDLAEAVTSKTKVIAETALESEQTKSELAGTEDELESLATINTDLHSECDWVLKNFDIRQAARLQEMEAIQAAKGILSGAK